MALIQRSALQLFDGDELLFDNWEITEDNITNNLEINNNGIKVIQFEDSTGDMTIKSNLNITGNLGIGTTPSTNLITLYDSIAPGILFQTSSNPTGTFVGGLSESFIISNTDNAGDIQILIDGNKKLEIENGGLINIDGIMNATNSTWQFAISDVLQVRYDTTAAYFSRGIISLTNGLTGAVIDTTGTDIRLSPNSTEAGALTIISNGNVGIGLQNPVSDLHIENTSGSAYTKYTNASTGSTSTDGFNIGINAFNKALLLNFENTDMEFYNNNTLRMVLDNDGMLDIQNTTPVIRLSDTRTSNDGQGNELGAIEFWNEDTSTTGPGLHSRILTENSDGGVKTAGLIRFENYDNGVVSGEMTLNALGFLGLGNGIENNAEVPLHLETVMTEVGGVIELLRLAWNDSGVINQDGGDGTKISFHTSNVNNSFGTEEAVAIAAVKAGGGEADTATDLVFSINNGTSVNEVMRIDHTGQVGIGTNPTISLAIGDSDTGFEYNASGNFSAISNGTEAWKIHDTARIGMGHSGNPQGQLHIYRASAEVLRLQMDEATPGTARAMTLKNKGNVDYMLIQGNGNLENLFNSYGGFSDVRFKENIIDCNSQWEDIKSMRFRKYNFISDETKLQQLGVIAQELELTSSGLVSNKNPERKSVKYSVMYMKGMVALQEAMTRIEKLEIQFNKILIQNQYLLEKIDDYASKIEKI